MDKKKIPFKQIKFIFILLILATIFLFLSYTVSKAYINKTSFENYAINIANKNNEVVFSINNITLFSSAGGDTQVNQNSTLGINNLYQYTDIAIFINPAEGELTQKNTLKEVYIDNINYITKPTVGAPELYYKNINNFATPSYQEENKITDSLNFNISSEDNADLNSPTLYNNCANPITLSYVNNNIKKDFTLADAFNGITYDGSLLKSCGVTINSINSSISFDIHIVNNLNQSFICPIYIEIPLESDDGSSIYDGKILKKQEANYTFYRCN